MKKNTNVNDPNALMQFFGELLKQQFATENLEVDSVKEPSTELISNQEISRLTKHLNDISEHLQKIRLLFRMSIKNTYNLEETCEFTQFTSSKIYRDTSQKEIRFTKHLGKTLLFKKEDLVEYMLKEKPDTK